MREGERERERERLKLLICDRGALWPHQRDSFCQLNGETDMQSGHHAEGTYCEDEGGDWGEVVTVDQSKGGRQLSRTSTRIKQPDDTPSSHCITVY